MIKHSDIIEETLRRNALQSRKNRIEAQDATPFEQWAAENWHLTPEKTLILNHAQRKLLQQFETARANGQKLSFAVPHASGLGITTFCEAYIYWLQNIDGTTDNTAIFYPDAKSKHAGKYRFYRNANARPQKFNIDTPRVKHLSNNSVTFNGDCIVNSYYTVRQTRPVRNLSPRYVLFADAAKLTPRKYKEEYILRNRREPLYEAYIAARSSSAAPLTVIEGNTDTPSIAGFWFDILNQPQSLQFSKIFLPWYANESHRMRLDHSVKDFYNSLSDYEYHILWKQLQLTLEQIYWYRRTTYYIADKTLVPKIYPSTEYEALTRTLHTVPARPADSYITAPTFDPVHIKEYQTGKIIGNTASGSGASGDMIGSTAPEPPPPKNRYDRAVLKIPLAPDVGIPDASVSPDSDDKPQKQPVLIPALEIAPI